MPTYGKVKVDTITYDLSGTATDVSVSNIATKASPTFTGTVTVPTPSADDNSTKAASTAYVQTELGDYALKASPTFTGTVTVPTPTAGDNSTKAASTAFVVASFAPKAAPAFTGNATGVNLTLSGDLTVQGTTTTIDTTTLQVEDKNIEIGKVSTPSDTTADGGGWTLKGATDKTFNWVNATDAWTSSEHIHLLDSKKALLGTDSDLQVYHSGSHGYITEGTGNLKISVADDNDVVQILKGSSENIAQFTAHGSCELYHDNSKKLETTSGGVTVTGTLAATAVTGDGSGLTNLPPGGNTFTAVANGAIANNKAVKLDTDGKVSQVAESVSDLSVPTAISSNLNIQYTANEQGTAYLRLARISDTQYAAIWFDDTNDKVRARIITVSGDGDTVTVASNLASSPYVQVLVTDSNAQDLDIAYDPNRGKLLAVWTATSSRHCYGKVGTVSGSGATAEIAWDSNTTEIRNGGSSDPTYGNKLVWNEDAQNFGYFCYTRGSDDKAYGRVVTINSSGGIELGTMLTLLPFSQEGQPIQEFYSLDAIYDTTNDKFGVWVTGKYTSGSKYRSSGAVCTTSGSGTSATLSMVNYYQGDLNFWQYNDSSLNGRHKLVQCCYDPSKDLVLTTYIDEDTAGAGHNHLYVRLFKQSGNEYYPGTTSTMVAATTSTWSIVYSPGINKPVLIWINSSGQVESKILTISGTSQSSSISYSTSTVIHSDTGWNDKLNTGWQYQNLGQWCRAVASAAGGRIFLPVQTYSGNIGHIVPMKLQNVVSNFTVADSYVGFADAAYTNGQTVTVKTVGNNVSTLSGLTIGSKYYVQGDGTVGTSAGSPSAIAGIAIAADKLLIREPT